MADLVKGPTLGATALESQANPLLDNFEGMAITVAAPAAPIGVSLISDDNFGALQTTRVLNTAGAEAAALRCRCPVPVHGRDAPRMARIGLASGGCLASRGCLEPPQRG